MIYIDFGKSCDVYSHMDNELMFSFPRFVRFGGIAYSTLVPEISSKAVCAWNDEMILLAGTELPEKEDMLFAMIGAPMIEDCAKFIDTE